MRILHIIHQYLPDHIGGTELYTHWLTQELARRGHEIAIFHRRSADGSGLARRTEAGIEIWSAWNGRFQPANRFLSTFRSPPLQDAFIKVLDTVKPELVHIQHLMGLPVSIVNTLRQHHIPYVVSLHDYWYVCANAQLITNDTQELCAGPDKFLNCARCALARAGKNSFPLAQPLLTLPLSRRNRRLEQVLTQAERLMVPSRFVKSWYGRHNIPLEKIKVAPLGLDYPAGFAGENAGIRPFRIGYIGGLSWQKGVHVLVNAFAQLPHPAELWIAGDPDFDPEYVAKLRQLAKGDVRFPGKLDRDGVWQMLAQVDVIVVPSLWYETFCFVVSEAFAMSVPVIASDLGVLADRVQDGVDGFLFPPGDDAALAVLLRRCQTEPDLLSGLRAHIQPGLTVAQHTDKIEAIYENVRAASVSDS